VIGDGLRSCRDDRRATEVDVAVHVLNRMLELGPELCPHCLIPNGVGLAAHIPLIRAPRWLTLQDRS
jgi:hypothetical protein